MVTSKLSRSPPPPPHALPYLTRGKEDVNKERERERGREEKKRVYVLVE
jgi:hypothetical protein